MSGLARLVLVAVVVVAALFALHVQVNLGGWSSFVTRVARGNHARGELVVGFLPVTCHLTCPVTNWVTSHSERGSLFRSKKYTEFATIAEELRQGKLQATFILAPLAMALRREGAPIRIVYLGHRDGTTLVVHRDSDIRRFEDLEGRTVAIPHNYSNQRILLAREIEKRSMDPTALKLVVYPPPEMPSALQARAIDAYIVGEPMAAKSEVEGFGRVLAFTKDLWPNFISCVLVVREDLIRDDRALVQELVDGIAASGKWIDAPGEDLTAGVRRASDAGVNDPSVAVVPEGWTPSHRMQAAAIASRRDYYNQDPELLRFVLSKPPDRVRYTDLVPARHDFEEIQRYAEKLGYFRPASSGDPFGFDDYCDPTFASSTTR
ncbi:MAG: ABC transporter substrate-binding protein [Planctomycetes bacterium]|nr:ABC transporter substrate-binding protein [Planctomycetota bacterium]MBI3846231.1 ABC transporter substrate-binding protein [Planctomycetota bacterium]